MTNPHVPFRDLVDLVDRGTAPSDVSRHLAVCPTCRRLSDDVTRLLGTMSYARTLDSPPENLRAEALRAIGAELSLRTTAATAGILQDWAARLGGHWRSFTAQLVGDSFHAASAVRAGNEISAAPRMLLYETEIYEITVSVAPSASPGALDVTGQVTPRQGDLPAGGVVGVRAGECTATSELSTFGVFSIDALPSGELDIEVGLAGTIIRLAPIPRPHAD